MSILDTLDRGKPSLTPRVVALLEHNDRRPHPGHGTAARQIAARVLARAHLVVKDAPAADTADVDSRKSLRQYEKHR